MNQVRIGTFIAQCRKNKRLTQRQLAEMLNTTDKSVSKWENGKCLPDASLYEPLCEILGITIGELFAAQKNGKENDQKTADAILLKMLKHKLYQASDQSIPFEAFAGALDSMAETAVILERFTTKEEAVAFLVKETELPVAECTMAYEFYLRLFRAG